LAAIKGDNTLIELAQQGCAFKLEQGVDASACGGRRGHIQAGLLAAAPNVKLKALHVK
jgi:hypothetical protein